MAVGVEASSLLFPMTLCGSSGHDAPHPPLRQAAGRYLPYVLVLWNIERLFPKILANHLILCCGGNRIDE